MTAARDNPELGYLKELSARGDVNWAHVETLYNEWRNESVGLSPASALLISLAVAIAAGPGGFQVAGQVASAASFGGSSAAAAAVNAGNNAAVFGAQVRAGGDIGVQAGNEVAIGVLQNRAEMVYEEDQSNKSFTATNRRTESLRANLDSGGTISVRSRGDATLQGAQLAALTTVEITSDEGAVNLLAARDEAYSHLQRVYSGTWVTKSLDAGFEERSAVYTEILAGGDVTINAAQGVNAEFIGPQGTSLADALTAARDRPELAYLKELSARGDVNWAHVETLYNEWRNESVGLVLRRRF